MKVVFHFKHVKPYLNAKVYVSSNFETVPGGWVVVVVVVVVKRN
jgi:hypothetical protein